MSSVLSAITKLPRHIHVLSTNGLDENVAFVLGDDDKQQEDIKEYRKKYWLDNKAQLKLKHSEDHNNKKVGLVKVN